MKIADYLKSVGAAIIGRPQSRLEGALERLILDTYGGGPSSSGISVTSSNAMRLITVQNCVRMRASTLARIPCHLMEMQGEKKEKAKNFYLYNKLLHQPNEWQTAPEFWGMAEAHVSLRGEFIAYKAQLEGRPIRELIPIPPSMINSITQREDYSIDYEIQAPKTGEIKHLSQTQVLHLRGLTIDGIRGLNPIEFARETIGKSIASDKHMAQFFGKGMRPGVIFEHPDVLNAQAHSNRKKVLKEKYEGLGAHWEMMLIDEGMKATFPEIKLVDAQFIEQMRMGEAQICGLFRVPQMLVNAGEKENTYASAEQFMLFYQMLSIDAPIYESAIRRDLLNEDEKTRYYAKFEMRGLLRGAFADQMNGLRTAINAEIMNPNEARDLLDMNGYPGGEIYKTRTSSMNEPANDPAKEGTKQ